MSRVCEIRGQIAKNGCSDSGATSVGVCQKVARVSISSFTEAFNNAGSAIVILRPLVVKRYFRWRGYLRIKPWSRSNLSCRLTFAESCLSLRFRKPIWPESFSRSALLRIPESSNDESFNANNKRRSLPMISNPRMRRPDLIRPLHSMPINSCSGVSVWNVASCFSKPASIL